MCPQILWSFVDSYNITAAVSELSLLRVISATHVKTREVCYRCNFIKNIFFLYSHFIKVHYGLHQDYVRMYFQAV